jgi:hypothetical protein
MMVNKTNLLAGIDFWISTKKHWPDDFHNRVYWNLKRWLEEGINQNWWRKIVVLLQSWQANRPYSRDRIFENGLPYLDALKDQFIALKGEHGGYPSLGAVQLDEIRPLFDTAVQIKRTKKKSPVFPSKLCHFLFPTVFFIADREAIRIVDTDYFDYWEESKREWYDASSKEQLVLVLRNQIEKSSKFELLFEDYPFPIKVTELCRIGHRKKA